MRFRCISTVNVVYFECRFVLLSSLYIYFQNSTNMVKEGFWIGLEVTNTPASHLRSAARAVDYLHRAFDVIPEVDVTSAWASSAACVGRASSTTRMTLSSTKLLCMTSSGEPGLVGVQISTNGCVGGDGPGAIAMRLFHLKGPHNAPLGARGTHHKFPAGSYNVCLAPPPGATRPRVPAASSVNAHHLPHATHLAKHDPTCPSRTSL